MPTFATNLMVHMPFSSPPCPPLGWNTISLGPLPASSRTLKALLRQGTLSALRVCPDLDGVTTAAREGGIDLVVCEVSGADCEGLLLPARLLSDAGKDGAHGMPIVLWISDLPKCALNAYAAGLRAAGAVIEIAPGPGAIAQALVRCASKPHSHTTSEESAPLYSDEDLIMALGAHDMRIVLQPQVELATGKIVGAEALARWRHPSAGEIPPADFVQAISRLSMAPMLFHFVTERALDMQAQLVKMGVSIPVSVNASASILAMSDVVSSLQARTLQRGISPRLITVEITEDEIQADNAALKCGLGRLRACGFCISMDDFGTGASTLERLTRLPFDEIKIDRSFVQSLPSDPTAYAVVSAVLRLGVELGLSVVAEGIETAEEALQVQALGGRVGQGYGLGKPMEVDAYLRMVQPLPTSRAAEPG
jgi:EAL domain-containing protein (putative c-di-GMP-specific phosphodiesterase class I)